MPSTIPSYSIVADSATATGLKWAAPAGGGLTFANSTVNTAETTSSTSYTDLATVQSVTLTTGTKALVLITAKMSNSNAGSSVRLGFAVSGATTISANDDANLFNPGEVAGASFTLSSSFYLGSLTAGSNTFTLKARVGGNTGNYEDRQLTVIDLGS